MKRSAILAKIDRLRDGSPPRVLDLFSGCGGLSLGFKSAGFEIAGAVESDPHAAASHGWNFHPDDENHAIPRSMESNPSEIALALGLAPPEQGVDVLIGGPPCQAFTRIGRPKLRDIQNHPEAYKHDPRARLYQRYLEYISAFKPLAILMENVPEVIRFGSRNIPEEVSEVLEESGYTCAYTLLNAAHYGVPQYRERMFLVAYRKELDVDVTFPRPTHRADLPKGYRDHRKGMLEKLVCTDLLGSRYHAVLPPLSYADLPQAVTVEQAIHDLPVVSGETVDRVVEFGFRALGTQRLYDKRRRVSEYAQMLKDWEGFAGGAGVSDHVIRSLPRDWRIFAGMKEGDRYPDAVRLAEKLFERELTRLRKTTSRKYRYGKLVDELRRTFVPPYPVDKFPDKWRKLARSEPSHTVTAHLGKDCYSHIHYDDGQARTISVREAARLQSFPDGFEFKGPMNAAFRQIGNAVPPLMAKALAGEMLGALTGYVSGAMEEGIIGKRAKELMEESGIYRKEAACDSGY
ncbi:MAG: DNA cytosine methyltransferase [Candidatus Thiodiazotropha endolucinida]